MFAATFATLVLGTLGVSVNEWLLLGLALAGLLGIILGSVWMVPSKESCLTHNQALRTGLAPPCARPVFLFSKLLFVLHMICFQYEYTRKRQV